MPGVLSAQVVSPAACAPHNGPHGRHVAGRKSRLPPLVGSSVHAGIFFGVAVLRDGDLVLTFISSDGRQGGASNKRTCARGRRRIPPPFTFILLHRLIPGMAMLVLAAWRMAMPGDKALRAHGHAKFSQDTVGRRGVPICWCTFTCLHVSRGLGHWAVCEPTRARTQNSPIGTRAGA